LGLVRDDPNWRPSEDNPMTDATPLAGYYAARATEYEQVYAKPERQADLARLRMVVAEFARERRVLEVACGTGYWTAELARTAKSVVGTDIGEAVLAVAQEKRLPSDRVTFRRADAFALDVVPDRVDAAFVGFWWSHVQLQDISKFLVGLHRRLEPGARILIMDNRYVLGSSSRIERTDPAGNTYQRRTLADGSVHEVLKNFPTPADVRHQLADAGAADIEQAELPYYWYAAYRVAVNSRDDG